MHFKMITSICGVMTTVSVFQTVTKNSSRYILFIIGGYDRVRSKNGQDYRGCYCRMLEPVSKIIKFNAKSAENEFGEVWNLYTSKTAHIGVNVL